MDFVLSNIKFVKHGQLLSNDLKKMLDIFKRKGKKIINESRAILSELIPGQKALIKNISTDCFGIERQRLMDLGFVPGSMVEVEVRSPFNGPTAYRIKGGLIALRKMQASKIQIFPA